MQNQKPERESVTLLPSGWGNTFCEKINKSESCFGKNLAKVENSQVNMIMIVMKAFVIQLASFPLPFPTPSPPLKICLKHCFLGVKNCFFCNFPQKFPTKYFPPKTIFHLSTHIMKIWVSHNLLVIVMFFLGVHKWQACHACCDLSYEGWCLNTGEAS